MTGAGEHRNRDGARDAVTALPGLQASSQPRSWFPAKVAYLASRRGVTALRGPHERKVLVPARRHAHRRPSCEASLATPAEEAQSLDAPTRSGLLGSPASRPAPGDDQSRPDAAEAYRDLAGLGAATGHRPNWRAPPSGWRSCLAASEAEPIAPRARVGRSVAAAGAAPPPRRDSPSSCATTTFSNSPTSTRGTAPTERRLAAAQGVRHRPVGGADLSRPGQGPCRPASADRLRGHRRSERHDDRMCSALLVWRERPPARPAALAGRGPRRHAVHLTVLEAAKAASRNAEYPAQGPGAHAGSRCCGRPLHPDAPAPPVPAACGDPDLVAPVRAVRPVESRPKTMRPGSGRAEGIVRTLELPAPSLWAPSPGS